MWLITEEHLEPISIGAGILGTGGGGNPYIGRLRARQLIRKHGPIEVLDVDELPSESRVKKALTPSLGTIDLKTSIAPVEQTTIAGSAFSIKKESSDDL